MSHSDQFDLFDRSAGSAAPPSAELFRFPLARRRKIIIRAATTLKARKTDEGQRSYWSRTIDTLAAELRRHGADQAEIGRQLSEFHRAVSAELSLQQASGPRGAA